MPRHEDDESSSECEDEEEEYDSSDWDSSDEASDCYEDIELWQEVFDSFDPKKTGAISQRALLKALRSLDHWVTQAEVREILKDFDEDGDGKCSFDEFCELVKYLESEDEEDEEEEDEEEEAPTKPTPTAHAPIAMPLPTVGGKKVIKKAVFIGINYPGSDAPLSGCVNDVRTMQNILQRLGYEITEKRVLVDDKRFKGRDGAPTRKNILNALQWLGNAAKSGDTLFLHYSGHGTQVEAEKDTKEEDGCDEAICPIDMDAAGVIIDDDIHKFVVKPLPNGCRLTAVFDCCHSGTIMDLPYNFRATKANMANAHSRGISMAPTGAKPIQNGGTVFMISGCRDDQTSADVEADDGAGGACTNAIAEVFASIGKKKKTPATMSIVDLLDKMRESLTRDEFEQIPQLSSSIPVSGAAAFGFVGPVE